MQVERGAFVAIRGYPSGERVSNALVTYPKVWDTSPKGLLIPHVISGIRCPVIKAERRFERDLRPISWLVG